MSLTKEDLEPYIGKEIEFLLFELTPPEYDELDSGTIVKVTHSAIHLDTSRKERDHSLEAQGKPEEEQWVPVKFTRVFPLSKILNIEIYMDEEE